MPPMNPPAKQNNAGTAKPNTAFVSAGGTPGFDMAGFQQELDNQKQLAANRQQEQIVAAGQTRDIMKRSAQLAQQQADSVGFLLKNVQIAQNKANHARALADSSNPMDRLELMGLQITDPNGYLRKQREARLQEDSQQAAILNQYFATQQDSLKTQLITSTADVDYMKTLETIGQEKLTAYVTQAKQMGDLLAANQTMKDVAINGLEVPELDAAIQQAKMNPQKVVNIGGVDIDSRTLETRKAALNERKYNMAVMERNTILAQDDLAHVDDVLRQRDYERAVDANKQKNLQSDLALADARRKAEMDDLSRTAQKKVLETYSIPELTALRANEYKDSTGKQFIPAMVEEAYQTRKAGEQAAVEDQLTQNALKNFDLQTLSTESQFADGLSKRVPVNSPLARQVQMFQSDVHTAALGAGPDNGPITRRTAIQGYLESRQRLDKAIESQVTTEAKGDKDVADMLRSFYRGDPVPKDSLFNAVSKRLTSFKSVADIFPPEVAAKVKAKYAEYYQQETQTQYGMPKLQGQDLKIAQDAAVQKAIDFGVNESLQLKTEQVNGSQVSMPDHPLYGKLTPGEYNAITANADMRARQITMNQFKLDEAKMQQVENGQDVEGAPPATQIIQTQQSLQNQELLMQLDMKFGPGVGHEVAQWWMTKGPDYIDRVQAGQQQASDSFINYNLASASTDVVRNQYDKYAMGLNMADADYTTALTNQAAEMFTFGRNPESMQVALLSADKNLTDPERTQILTQVIKPLLDSAAQKGLSFEDTNRYVEQNIMNYEAQTPEMKGLLKTLRRDRAENVAAMGTYSALLKQLGIGMTYGGRVDDPRTKWYTDTQPKKPATTQWYSNPLPKVEIGKPDL